MELPFTEMGKAAGRAGLGEDSGIPGLVSYILSFRCLVDIQISRLRRTVDGDE